MNEGIHNRRVGEWRKLPGLEVDGSYLSFDYLLDQAFSRDGKRLIAIWAVLNKPQASGGPVVLEVPMLEAPVPGWFSDFLRCLLQCTVDREGRRRVLTPNEWAQPCRGILYDRVEYKKLAVNCLGKPLTPSHPPP